MVKKEEARHSAYIMRGTGITQEVNKQGSLPLKIPGKHRWVCVTTYNVSDRIAQELFKNPESVHFDIENMAMYEFGCFDCEMALRKQTIHTRCQAEGWKPQ